LQTFKNTDKETGMTHDSIHPHWLGLESRVCVVTGAAGGIGRAIGETLASAGARLALLDRDEAGCNDAANALRERGIEAIAIACDISDPASVNRAAEQVERKLGHADVLVNNAGLLRAGGIEDIGLDAWNAMLAVNLTGYMLCSQAFAGGMLARTTRRPIAAPTARARRPSRCSRARSPPNGVRVACAATPYAPA
jgi:NAD(P)-dependent dehydrogenase (short-subunit alcohol dehydrogenase family)